MQNTSLHLAVYCLRNFKNPIRTKSLSPEYTIQPADRRYFDGSVQTKTGSSLFLLLCWNIEYVNESSRDKNCSLPAHLAGREFEDLLWCKTSSEISRGYRNPWGEKRRGKETFWTAWPYSHGKTESLSDSRHYLPTLRDQITENPWRPVMDLSMESPLSTTIWKIFRIRSFYYESSQGCLFPAATALLIHWQSACVLGSVSRNRRELQFFLTWGSQVKFVDRTFNCNPGMPRPYGII